MFARRPATDSTYRRSQAATGLPVAPTQTARSLVTGVLECGDDYHDRQRAAQALVDELSSCAGLPRVAVVVADRAQVHEHDGQRLQSKTYGYYRCVLNAEGVSNPRIRIYHRTAVRQKTISPKVFLNTLLHEWVHHYDFAHLRLARSPHTSGFYARLRALAEALGAGFVLPPDPDAQPGTRDLGAPGSAARSQRLRPPE